MKLLAEIRSYPALVINLDRRPDRWEQIQAELARVQWSGPIHRISAVDGCSISDFEFEDYKERYMGRKAAFFMQRYKKARQWWAGMFGCALSHLNALRYALLCDYMPFAVFEDDAKFSDKFLSAEYPEGDPGLIIPGHNGQTITGGRTNAYKGWFQIQGGIWGTHCYVVTREEVRRDLLDVWSPMDINVDEGWWDMFEDAGTVTHFPPLVVPSGSTSDINV